MRGIVTNEVSEYMAALIEGAISTDPIEFIRCVDERAFHILAIASETMVNRTLGELQLTLGDKFSPDDITHVTNSIKPNIQLSLAYGWILEHLSRLAIDLKKTPSLGLYMSAAIDSEGDLKKLKERLTTRKTPSKIESQEEKEFNKFLGELKSVL